MQKVITQIGQDMMIVIMPHTNTIFQRVIVEMATKIGLLESRANMRGYTEETETMTQTMDNISFQCTKLSN